MAMKGYRQCVRWCCSLTFTREEKDSIEQGKQKGADLRTEQTTTRDVASYDERQYDLDEIGTWRQS